MPDFGIKPIETYEVTGNDPFTKIRKIGKTIPCIVLFSDSVNSIIYIPKLEGYAWGCFLLCEKNIRNNWVMTNANKACYVNQRYLDPEFTQIFKDLNLKFQLETNPDQSKIKKEVEKKNPQITECPKCGDERKTSKPLIQCSKCGTQFVT